MLVLFSMFFSFYLIYLIITLYDTTLQSDPRPKLLGLILQPNPLKLGSCKFNIIITIINITFRSSVITKPKTLGYSFAERPNTLDLSFFDIFYTKNKLTRGIARVI
jgi:hypothetical protein